MQLSNPSLSCIAFCKQKKIRQKTVNLPGCLSTPRLCLPLTPAGLLQGLYLRQSAGGARAEVHGREERGHSTDGAGRPFPQAHPRAPTAVQLQLHGRHAGHLRRGRVPTVRQGLQGEWKGQRRQRSPDQTCCDDMKLLGGRADDGNEFPVIILPLQAQSCKLAATNLNCFNVATQSNSVVIYIAKRCYSSLCI